MLGWEQAGVEAQGQEGFCVLPDGQSGQQHFFEVAFSACTDRNDEASGAKKNILLSGRQTIAAIIALRTNHFMSQKLHRFS